MKLVIFLMAIYFISCGGKTPDKMNTEANLLPTPTPIIYRPEHTPYLVDGFTLKLTEQEGHCRLSYQKGNEKALIEDMGLKSPCEFIRLGKDPYPLQIYHFGSGKQRLAALLVTGGPSHKRFTDQFMPGGCGTALSKIRIYSDRLVITFHGEGEPEDDLDAYCPSNPLDDVFFAT